MVLTSTGEVLTNNHVINGATSIKVTDIGNGRTYTAKVVGYDASHDVAVIQLQGASGLQTVDPGRLRPAQPARRWWRWATRSARAAPRRSPPARSPR